MNELITAVLAKNSRHVEALLAAGCDLQQADSEGRTALMEAAMEGLNDIVLLLIRAGANLNAPDRRGFTALHFAAQGFQVETARLLLENGAKVDAVDSNGNTPLWRAVFESRGRGGMIAQLLIAGADPDLRNRSGVSPIELARQIANYDVMQFFPELGELNSASSTTDPPE